MRKRGVIFILASIPAWVYVLHFLYEVRKSPFGSEFGSIAFPAPLLFEVADAFALLLALIGLPLFVFDFVQWVKKRPHADSN